MSLCVIDLGELLADYSRKGSFEALRNRLFLIKHVFVERILSRQNALRVAHGVECIQTESLFEVVS